MPSTVVTRRRMIWSATRKNTEAIATITNTMAVVTTVSRRDGQVTFRASARTSFRNWKGLTFGIGSPIKWQYSPRRRDHQPQRQGVKDVFETCIRTRKPGCSEREIRAGGARVKGLKD